VDPFSAAFGWHALLTKLQKKATIVSANTLPKALKHIAPGCASSLDVPNLHALVIEIDTREVKIAQMQKEERPELTRILLTPTDGVWSEGDVRVFRSPYAYDLLICIGAHGLEACEKLHKHYADFFYRTPILNIDHSPANEHFGQLNVVDLTATSCSEVCHDLVMALYPHLVDEEIATLLLAGMIAKTKSFKTRNVTPKTLTTASTLIEKGARREEIINHLYRVRSVSTLRLWGRALARLKHDVQRHLVWTMLSQQDFLHAGAEDDDLPEVIDELIACSPDAELALLLYEDRDHCIRAFLRANPPHHAARILKTFSPSGSHEEAHVRLQNMSLVEAERVVLKAITL
jgi:nanoRNase/pAp phosphatase (c-di-AMP/oligoRNAs hydrolase)